MKLLLDDEQRAVQDAAQRFFSAESPVAALRALRDRHDETGYNPSVWRQMADLGFAATALSEEHGGIALGDRALGAIFEASGRTLTASPLFATVVLGASVVAWCGSTPQQSALLPRVVNGSLTLALAWQEDLQGRYETLQCTATQAGGRYVINGTKSWVLDGSSADQLIVVARTSGAPGSRAGLSFLLVPADAPGLSRTRLWLADSRSIATLRFDHVRVGEAALLGIEGGAWSVLERVAQRARALLAAEMLGGSTELFERTLAYLTTREQFGVKIGSFQALRHRAARLYAELELTRSAVMAALAARDEDAPDAPALACLAKCRANDTFLLIGNEAIQMHGGIGMTDELDIGLFVKRARVAAQIFGDSRTLRDAYATLKGY